MARNVRHKLSEEAKEFVVSQLACFETPGAVVKALKREFNVAITAPSVQAYDPTKRAGARLSQHWCQIFQTTRERFLKSTAEIGISHKTFRLRALQRMAEAAENKKQYALAAQLLEQAAKEVGNAFSNHRVLSGPSNGPLRVSHTITDKMSHRDAQQAWHEIMGDGPAM